MEEQLSEEEEVRRKNRQKRLEEMRISKQKQMMRRMYMKKAAPFVSGAFIIFILVIGGRKLFAKPVVEKQAADQTLTAEKQEEKAPVEEKTPGAKEEAADSRSFSMKQILKEIQTAGIGVEIGAADDLTGEETSPDSQPEGASLKTYQAEFTSDTEKIGAYLAEDQEFYSEYGLLIDLRDNRVIAEKYGKTRINPASMTKILTVLVAAEHIEPEDLDDKFTMTLEITDYGYIHDCSSAGFEKDEVVTVRDLFYGTVLPSGADAAVGLSVYVSGSQEAFVELMNEKLEELGLSETAHFTNCVGIYDENHYCTAYDMAMIMEAAIENELCREVLTAHTYTTSETAQHPEGIIISNWFLRRIEDKEGGEGVVCAKTGYVAQSKSCAASYAEDKEGNGYICVTAGAESQWRCIYDHAGLYRKYLS